MTTISTAIEHCAINHSIEQQKSIIAIRIRKVKVKPFYLNIK